MLKKEHLPFSRTRSTASASGRFAFGPAGARSGPDWARCSTRIYVAFSGIDAAGQVFHSGTAIQSLTDLSASAFFESAQVALAATFDRSASGGAFITPGAARRRRLLRSMRPAGGRV